MNIIPRTPTAKQKAFTLVETLVAISILTIALTGPLAIIAQALRSSYFSRDQITAYYLAQEAVEYIRNQRDFNGLQGVSAPAAEDWLHGVATDSDLDPTDPNASLVNLYEPTGESNLVKANLVRTATGYKLTRCNVACPPLKYNVSFNTLGNAGSSLYGDDSTEADSIFTREIIFSEPPPYVDPANPDPDNAPPSQRELVMTVRVTWSSPSGSASVSIREHLTNWQLEKIDPNII
jgi:prepilin-type N-terminal cleavage/methylation domain-containing protein